MRTVWMQASRLACAVGRLTLLLMLGSSGIGAAEIKRLESTDGYRGIWYANQKSNDEYGWKYSGGMATYPQQHAPLAWYASAANKTFFVYGGVEDDSLLHMVSYYDHATNTVPRPRILLDKKTTDAHDNPTLALDAGGYLWVFSNSHGGSRPSYIHRSAEPYSIDAFEQVLKTNFSYGQPWRLLDHGFLFLHTRYRDGGRSLFIMTSRDGQEWTKPDLFARFGQGHYQVSWSNGRRVATCFNYHPEQGGLNARTNLYYLEATDGGHTWRTADGETARLPLREVHNAALVRDYERLGLLVYLKDVQFDHRGHPVLLYLTSRGYASGPESGPRTWRIAHWIGDRWAFQEVTTSDHNYDFGSLYIEDDRTWRLIAPTEPGPQPYTTGGQMAMWTSTDEGRTWTKIKNLTHDGSRQHSYARRPVHAHPDFYALWADGDALERSPSSLYFTNRAGDNVWRLPVEMNAAHASPEVAW